MILHMRNIILTLAVIATASITHGQTTDAEVTLNIKLHPVQTIVVNPAQKEVNLEYRTKEDYKNGVTAEQKDHLTIFSTGSFGVKVHTASDKVTSTNAPNYNIESSSISIMPTPGSNQLEGASLFAVALSSEPQNIISNGSGSGNKNFNISYGGGKANEYMDKYFKGGGATEYSTNVTYTLEAQ